MNSQTPPSTFGLDPEDAILGGLMNEGRIPSDGGPLAPNLFSPAEPAHRRRDKRAAVKVHDLLASLDGVREGARGWTARCPAHEDRAPSLSVSEGDDGRILLHCFAGCSVESITAAIGLTVSDLFGEGPAPTRLREQESPETPAALWAMVRQETRRERRRLLDLEGEIASGVFHLHQRAQGIRRAIPALGRDDERALDLLADAAALERAALHAEAVLDEMRAENQAVAFAGRGA